MNKRIAAFFLSVCAVLILTVSAGAIGEKMNALRGTPEIDGMIDPIWSKADRQKLSHRTGGEDGRKDSALAYVSVLWDDEAIYFLFEMIDNDFTFDAPAGSELNDSIYLMIDEGDMFGPTWQPGQTRVALSPALGKSLYPMNGYAPKDFEMAFAEDIDGHWNIEFKYVPHTADLKTVSGLLMDFQLNDARPDGVLDAVFNWSDELGESAEDSASWSYVQFRSSGTKSGIGFSTADDAAESINRTPVKTYLFMEGTEGYGGEGPGNLFDNNVTTKFCTGYFPMRSVTRLKSAMVIDGIIMATANDNSSYNGRNPNDWKIEGSTDNKTWELILSGDETFFDEVDFTYFAVPIEDTPLYRYIRFTNKSAKSGTCQISELVLCSTDESIKNAASKQEEFVPVDKDSLVNYESPARLASSTPAEPENAGTGAEQSSPGGTGTTVQNPGKASGALPGVIAAGLIVVGFAAAAIIVPKIHKED